MTRSPFGPKTAIAAVAGDLFLVTRGTGESLEIEKLDPRAAATAALIATGIDAYLGGTAWRTGGGGGGGGNAVLNGSGAPAGGTGADGDFYINTSAWTIYGPKAAGAWGSATSLVGPAGDDGPAGADGAAILSGPGAPGSGLGANGDFYFDSTGKSFYGPKAAGAWGSGVSVAGPTGPTGAAGADGDDGREVELHKGATHIEWRYAGAPDWSELVALSTLVGPQGATGAQGNPGADGDDGAAGADGRTILSGSGAPASGLGVNGDFYLDVADRAIYGPKASGSWPSPVSLAGNAGADGDDGSTVLSGAGAPAGGTGVDGDFYIDTTTWAIHGPKAGGAWPAAVVLKPPVEVVTSLPGSPDPSTFYVITG